MVLKRRSRKIEVLSSLFIFLALALLPFVNGITQDSIEADLGIGNIAPNITSHTPLELSHLIASTDILELNATVLDVNGEILLWNFTSNGELKASGSIIGNGTLSYIFSAPNGIHSVLFTVIDPFGLQDNLTWTITINATGGMPGSPTGISEPEPEENVTVIPEVLVVEEELPLLERIARRIAPTYPMLGYLIMLLLVYVLIFQVDWTASNFLFPSPEEKKERRLRTGGSKRGNKFDAAIE